MRTKLPPRPDLVIAISDPSLDQRGGPGPTMAYRKVTRSTSGHCRPARAVCRAPIVLRFGATRGRCHVAIRGPTRVALVAGRSPSSRSQAARSPRLCRSRCPSYRSDRTRTLTVLHRATMWDSLLHPTAEVTWTGFVRRTCADESRFGIPSANASDVKQRQPRERT